MGGLLAVDLWSPHHGLSLAMVVATAFLLGVIHGITPDEHTWPITFSYARGPGAPRPPRWPPCTDSWPAGAWAPSR